MKKTLKEVELEVGLTRRQIQEYELYGTEKDKDKTENKKRKSYHKPFCFKPTLENGKLMYDEKAIERLWQIRFYRELGFSKNDISNIFNDETYDKITSLNSQIEMLEQKKEEIEVLILNAKQYLKIGSTAFDKRTQIPSPYISFNFLMEFYKFAVNTKEFDTLSDYIYKEYKKFDENIDHSYVKEFTELIENLTKFHRNGIEYNDEKVQSTISNFYYCVADISKKSKTYYFIMLIIEYRILLEITKDDENHQEVQSYVSFAYDGLIEFYFNSTDSIISNSLYSIYLNTNLESPKFNTDDEKYIISIVDRINKLFEINDPQLIINLSIELLSRIHMQTSEKKSRNLSSYFIDILKNIREN